MTGKAGLFLRVRDTDGWTLAFDNMDSRPIRGSRDWRRYEVVLDVAPEAAEVAFGVFLPAGGTLRADDFTLEPVGPGVPLAGPETTPAPDLPPSGRSADGSPGHEAGSDWLLGETTPDEYRVELDPDGGRKGSAAATLRSAVPEPTGFVSVMRWVDAEPFRGRRLQLSAWVKAESVAGWAGLWLRVDAPGSRRTLAFDNMEPRPIRGTADWRRYEVVLDVSNRADRIYYGALLDGPGGIRVDELALNVVGPGEPSTDLLARADAPENLAGCPCCTRRLGALQALETALGDARSEHPLPGLQGVLDRVRAGAPSPPRPPAGHAGLSSRLAGHRTFRLAGRLLAHVSSPYAV